VIFRLAPVVAALVAGLVLVSAASADDPLVAPVTTLSEDGRSATDGQRTLTVSQILVPDAGLGIQVQGSGYNTEKGIYVGFCVIPQLNQTPTPCGGGVDLEGDGGTSFWISSNPPRYGTGLAIPYGPGGSFSVTLDVAPRINDSIDCRTTPCAVITRSDHTRLSDRSQDIFVPVSFGNATPAPTAAPTSGPTAAPTAAPTQSAAPGGTSATPGPSGTVDASASASGTPRPTRSAGATAAGSVSTPDDDRDDEAVVEGGGGGGSGWVLWAGLGVLGLGMLAVGAFFLRQRYLAGLSLLLLAMLVLAGCSSSSSGEPSSPQPTQVSDTPIVIVDNPVEPRLPVTVTSSGGEEVTVTDVSRIVSLWGNVTEVVFGLGLGENVVGRDVTATFPEAKDLPLVTRAHDVSAESVLSLHPTVVLASSDTGPSEALQHIRDVGIPVVQFEEPNSVDDIVPRIEAIAAALGVPSAGEALAANVQDNMDAVREEIPEAEAPRVAFLYMRGQAGVYLIAGPGSGADSMIEAAGGIDAGTEMGLDNPFTPITSEALVEAAPDVILMTTTGLESVGGIDGLVKIPGIGQTPAGENRRVITIEDGLLYSFGPRTPATLEALIADLYGASS
jgi:iron complex transport system substrate-binding protein